jgi:uncharacterized phiE125 gp8 family phage protein
MLEDQLILQYVAAARRTIELAIEHSIAQQGWEAFVGGVGSTAEPIPLSMGPVKLIQTVDAYQPDGATTPITGYTLVGDVLGSPEAGWPASPTVIRVRYIAGMDVPPPPLLQAMLLLVGEYYDHRSAVITGTIVAEMPHAIGWLLSPYRSTTGLVVL